MKSDLPSVTRAAKEALLPQRGAEFRVHYFRGMHEVEASSEVHDLVKAFSAGLTVTVHGEDTKVHQRRQLKPALKGGIYRTMLVVEFKGVFIHVLGDQIVVANQKFKIGQLAPGLLRG